jgi:enamine deaminase RidA (YjgF/YER057c/UK114 family)
MAPILCALAISLASVMPLACERPAAGGGWTTCGGARCSLGLDEAAVRSINPPTIRPPFANYSHGVEVPAGCRWVLVSGQLGITSEDQVPEDAGAQAELCFRAIGAVLHEAGMSHADIVRINAFVTDRAHLKPYMEVRDRYVASPPPASTLMIVAGLARPEFKVEVEVVAARAD